MHQNISRGACN